MNYILNFRKGDRNIIEEYTEWFFHKTAKELVELYNREVRKGITGVHRQALYLIALKQVYLKRFGVILIQVLSALSRIPEIPILTRRSLTRYFST